MKTIVVIPTYNEKENIKILIPEILKISPEIEVLVVDDMSPDKTYEIVESFACDNKRVHLLLRHAEKGRGLAGIAGFKKALLMGADLIFEMDADLSHEPKYIPFMLREIENCDVVIGSRFVKGGGEDGRTFSRYIITRLSNLYIRFLLSLPVLDCTSGYRLFRRRVLEKMDFEKFISKGPSVVQEVLYQAYKMGFKIKEIPIIFKERKFGRSNFGIKIMQDSLLKMLEIRRKYGNTNR